MKVKKFLQASFLFFLAVGGVVAVTDKVFRALHKEKFLYMDVKVWSEKGYHTATIRDERKIREIKELFYSLKSFKGTVWFGVPDMETCPVEVWNNYEEEFYRICKGKNGKWYVELPGSYKGRSTTNYYKVNGEEARRLINFLESLIKSLISVKTLNVNVL